MTGLFKLLGSARKKVSPDNSVDRFAKLQHIGGYVDAPVSPGGSFKAQFDITITRNTSNITENLEVAILGFTEVFSGYDGFISPVTGGTVALTGAIFNSLPDRYRFTHVSGADTDTVDITSATHVYPSLITSSGFDRYRINNIRYTVSDAALADSQFNNTFEFRKRSIFGLESTNPISVASFKDPMNNQNNIIDIPINMDFDKETCIVMAMAPEAVAATAYEVTLSFFVEFFNKIDSSTMRGALRTDMRK